MIKKKEKKQRDGEALLKGGINAILKSMEEPPCSNNKAAPTSTLIWSRQITFLRRRGKQQVACWILAAKASVNKRNKLQLRLPQGLK